MTTAPVHPEPSAAPFAPPTSYGTSGRGRPARRAAALLVAGSLLTAVLGVSAPVVASAGVTGLDRSGGRGGGWGGAGSGYAGTPTSTVDAQQATRAESRGVALIDTVLTDGEAAGTGIVLTADGQVLTNYHVVEGSTSIKVTIAATGRTYTGTVVGADQAADVALVHLEDASGLTVARIDDDLVRVGDDVTAVGNAGGTGSLTAADGEVKALSASITTESEGTVAGEKLTKLIETSADVVPGDSGGPLLDDQGEVVGIDTAASSGQDIDGYAVPIATALAVVSQIRSGDETAAVRIGPAAFLGVQVAARTASDSGYGDGSWGGNAGAGGSGATIAGVVDGDAADEAGLEAGDTITRIGSTAVTDASDLTKALRTMNPGDRVTVTWTTEAGDAESATLTLDPSPVN